MKKRIAILHPHIKVKWWAIKTLLFLGSHFMQEWHNVRFYTFSSDKKNCFSDLNKDLDIVDLNVGGFGKIISMIRLAFQLRKFDIVIAWNSPMHFVAAVAKLLNPKIKTFWFLQNIPLYYWEDVKGVIIKIKRILEKAILPFIDIIVVNSTFIRDEAFKYFKRESKILYPSIDTDFFKNNHSSLEENQTIFTYSRLVKWKNVGLAIDAYIELQKNHPGLKLVIWWDWEEKGVLEEKAKFFSDIQFIWEMDSNSIREYLQRCTIFLFTSTIDAFGLTILEAMSMEKAVVSLICWWSKELIWHGDNWYLASDLDSFVGYIDELLRDPDLRASMWNKWREWASEHFSLNAMFESAQKIFIN